MSDELGLLDDCLAEPLPYMLIERGLYGGDRLRLLRGLQMLLRDGLIEILNDGAGVEDWELATWMRQPNDAATCASLERVTLFTTGAGAKLV